MAIEVSAKDTVTLAADFLTQTGVASTATASMFFKKYGGSIEVQWHSVKLTMPGYLPVVVMLPINSTRITAGKATPAELAHVKDLVLVGINELVAKHDPAAAPKHYPGKPIPVPAPHIAAAYDAADAAAHAAPAPKPVTPYATGEAAVQPVKLSEATMLGQPVFGTSEGSIYRVVGIGPRLRMAARLKAAKLSVRVEGPLSAKERTALTAMSFKDNGEYLSAHFGLNEVPAERIIGCLFFNPELELTHKIKNLKEAAGGV